MSGFGKTAGPTPSTSSQPRFGPPPSSFPSPPSPPPPRYAPRGYEAAPQAVRPLQAVRPPQFSYQSSSGLAPRGYQPSGIPRRPEGFGGVRSPPVPGQSTRPIGSPSYSSVRPNKFVNDQRSLFNDDAQTNSRRPVTSVVASRSSGNSVTAKISRSQDLKRTRPPFLHSSYEGISRQQTSFQRPALAARARDSLPNLSENYSNFTSPQDSFPVSPYAGSYDSGKRFRNETVEVNGPKQSKSLPRPSATEVLQENTPFAQSRPSGSPPRLGTRLNNLSNAYDPQKIQRPSPVKDPQMFHRSSPSVTGIGEVTPSRTVGFPVAKRTRSPPSPSINKLSQGNSDSTQDDAEREMQAKARRLARFKEELSHNFESESTPDVVDQNLETSQQMKSAMEFTNGNASSDFEGMETSNAIIGLCPDMCPESERAERERKGDLDRYERLDGDRNQTNKFLAIKKYTRTAEREASLIRPMPILQKTVDYLLHLLDQPYDDRFLRMYNFLWDRMRAVRMDLRMQHIFNQGAITMLEQMIRLHIIAMHELCEYTKGEGFSEGFDAHLNIEQMNKTSVELFQMYDDHRKRGIDVPSEKEFRGYYALLKLDKHPGYKVEPAELSLDLAKMTPNIRQTPEVLFARDVARACRTSNFIIFFRLARKATYLQACLMHAHFAKLRTQALASLHSGVQMNQGIPIAQVAQWLAMEEEEIQSLLEYHGFVIKEFEEPYMVKECTFLNSEKDYPTKCSKLVHLKKLSRIVGDVSPMSSVVPLPTQTAKKQQLPKIYRHETKAAPSASVDKSKSVNQIDNAFVGRGEYVSEIDEEMLDFRAASSPKVSAPPKQSMEENSMAKQKRQADPKVVDAYFSPLSFSSQQKFTESQPVKFGVPERQNLGGSHASPERVSSPKISSASLQEWLPSAKYGSSLVEDVSSPRTSRASLLERLPSGRYGNTLMEGVSSPRTPKVSLQERFPSGISNTMENSNTETVGFSSSEVEETAITQVEENNVVENYNEEVAQAKLRLIVRLWRRHSSRLKELRQQRHIAANAALNSLSLGPPIRQARDQPSAASEFDIDHVMRERCRKYEESWSKLNVSDVIVDILDRRNPNTGFLCWKMILCNQMGDKLEQSSKVTQVAAGSWLFSKLLPPRKDDDSSDDDLLISYPGLAIWKQWVPSTSDSDLICCMSIVRDINSDDVNETTAGASAVLFLASESIPWNLQKAQLHNLLLSVPSGSSLPLLVLSDSKQDLSSVSTIVSELGLNDVDESRISSFRVVFLVEDNQMEHVDGFFSDTQLREGIRWLASESPLQPDLHCIKTRDLVLSHLNPAMQLLERLSDYEIRPNHCISAFNEALDSSLEKIDAAAKANPTGWPCPEIDLLEGLCDEHVVVKWHLPSTGWSSASSIEPLLCALRECKLPNLPDSISWSGKSSNTGAEIENLRSQLENCITEYLTQSSGMMGSLLAAKEAHVMLQRSARLELHDSSYYIVPKWVMVFRRIFNWRLTSLSNGTYSSAYVLMGDDVHPDSEVTDELGYEEDRAFPYLSQPSLDEVIDAGCSPLLLRGQPEPEALQRPQAEVSDGDIRTASNANDLVLNDNRAEKSNNLMENERAKLLGLQKYESMANGVDRTSLKVVSSNKVKEAGNNDRLNKLLEQCNIVQNSIEQKLFIYF